MSYHEVELARLSVSVSYGVSLTSWALPVEISVGGSGLKERGLSASLLCFWFALRWWPRAYAVPDQARRDDGTGHADWLKGFEPERDFGYLLECLDIDASQIATEAVRLRNAVDLLRELRVEQTKGRGE